MGLIYDSEDSTTVRDTLSRNLAAALSVLGTARNASNRLISALSTGELSGTGYSALEGLFALVIGPALVNATTEIDSLRTDLEAFTREDSKVRPYGVLKEDELNAQLEAMRRQRDATKRLMQVNSAVADGAAAVPGLGEVLRAANTHLEGVLPRLDADIRTLEDKLRALREFDAVTAGLFRARISTPTVPSMVAASVSRPDSQTRWGPSELMNLLTVLGPEELGRIAIGDSQLVQQFWDTPPSAEAVATWWKSLSPEMRERWCQSAPAIIGNLPGLDADTRIHANMIQFQRDVNNPAIDPSSPRGIVIQDILKALGVDTVSGPGLDLEKLARESDPARGLLAYNATREPPLAAIAIGNTAAEKSGKVTWTVPGMSSGLGEPGRLAGWTNAAANLYEAQRQTEAGVPHLVVAWVGYAPPGGVPDPSVLQGDRARAGANRLARELDGQWVASAIIGGNSYPFTAVVGYSYGTTVVANAVSANAGLAHTVQSVVFLASAGLENDIPTAGSLRVDGGAGRVYATQSSQDAVADVGRFGSGRADPRDPSFGSKVFSSEGDLARNLQPTDGHDALGHGSDRGGVGALAHATAGHGYFDIGTEALKNAAAASLGLDAKINGGTRAGKGK